MENDPFLAFLTSWLFFFQDLRQVKEWVILKLFETIRVQHVDACQILWFYDLICFMIEIGREESSNLWKMIIF